MRLQVKVEGEEGCLVRTSKLNFVDLAGSEKHQLQQSSGVMEILQKEANKINTSLLTLRLVMQNLASNKFPPYRDSVLTKILKDSFGGNSITFFTGTISAQ